VGRRRWFLLRPAQDARWQRSPAQSTIIGRLLPLCATTVIEKWQRDHIPNAMKYMAERFRRIPELSSTIHPTGPDHLGVADRGIMALLNPERLRRVLSRMLDENEFLSPFGIRSISSFIKITRLLSMCRARSIA
jgi:hypothetical protein